jgi:hypothetical protein
MIPLGIFAQGPSEIVSPAAEIIGLPSALSTGQPFGNAKSIAPEKPRGGRISAPESWTAGIRQTLELRLAGRGVGNAKTAAVAWRDIRRTMFGPITLQRKRRPCHGAKN